jgi:hypothetical protein
MIQSAPLEGKARTAEVLAVAGYFPFALCALVLLITDRNTPLWLDALGAMRAYGIAILSFLGGVRWGAAIDDEGAGRTFLHSVVPSLVGWSTVFMTPVFALAILAMAFAGQGAWDVLSAQNAVLPRWYGTIRMKLTLLVVSALLVSLFVVG